MTDLSLADRILDCSAEAVMITDMNNRIVRVNRAFTRITGYTAQEAVGSPPTLLSSGKHPKSYYEDLWFSLKQRGYWQGEIWNKRKSGEIYPEWVSISLLRDELGNVTHHVAFFSDISLQKEGHAELQRLAHYDSLTGLPNRLLMRDRLKHAIGAAEKSNRHVAVLFVDLDRFKHINDQYGHKAGDDVLVAAADRMSRVLGSKDTLCRQGGDEFVVILQDLDEPFGAAFVADRLVKEVSRPYRQSDEELKIGASVGMAIYPIDGREMDVLLDAADAAMYQAKRTGRGRFQCGEALSRLINAA